MRSSAPATTRGFSLRRPAQQVREMLAFAFEACVTERGRELCPSFELRRAADIAAAWLTGDQSRGLKILGGCGTGKSTLLEAMRRVTCYCHGWPMAQRDAGFALFQANQVADTFRYEERHWDQRMFFLYRILALDDVGIEPTAVKCYGTEVTPLTDILHRRSNVGLPTLIVTNLDEEGLMAKYGYRVHDRLREMTTIILDGPSHRTKEPPAAQKVAAGGGLF